MAEKRSPADPDPRTEAELRIELAKSQQYQAILEQDRDHWKWSHTLLGYTLMSERERWRERDEAKIRWAEGLQSDLAAARSEVARLEWGLREREAELGRQRVAYDEQADRLARLEGELREREAELGRQRAAYDAQADRLAQLEGELREREAELAAARMAVEERDREVTRLGEELREREAELGRQRAAYDAQADGLARLAEELREREAELAAARMAVEERDREVTRLEEEIASVKRHWTYRMQAHWLYKLCARLKNWAIRTGLIRPQGSK
jgi:chromosome segregation ATPase